MFTRAAVCDATIPPVNRRDLIERLRDQLPLLDERERDYIVRTILQAMTDALARGRRIEIRDFGVFHLCDRNARLAHNPKTREKLFVPAKRVLRFRPGKGLSKRVQRGP